MLYICNYHDFSLPRTMNTQEIHKDIIERINKGDEKAFELLYNHYFVYLCSCTNAYIFNANEAQDIVNEVFVNIWHRRGTLNHPIHPYLMQSIRNGSLNYLRSLRSRENVIDQYREELLDFQEEYCLTEESPLHDLEIAELENEVRTLVSALPDKCREVFRLFLYDNLSPREIAERYDLSAGTVRVHIKHAMDKIKKMMEGRLGILLLFLFH